MAQAQPKIDWTTNGSTGQVPPASAMHAPSPARALQQLLDDRTAQSVDIERWSRRRQVAFIVVSSCALWAAILELATQAVRAIA